MYILFFVDWCFWGVAQKDHVLKNLRTTVMAINLRLRQLTHRPALLQPQLNMKIIKLQIPPLRLG
jgi:hypothetical protein